MRIRVDSLVVVTEREISAKYQSAKMPKIDKCHKKTCGSAKLYVLDDDRIIFSRDLPCGLGLAHGDVLHHPLYGLDGGTTHLRSHLQTDPSGQIRALITNECLLYKLND